MHTDIVDPPANPDEPSLLELRGRALDKRIHAMETVTKSRVADAAATSAGRHLALALQCQAAGDATRATVHNKRALQLAQLFTTIIHHHT